MVSLVCPNCDFKETHDFTDYNDQESTVGLQCSKCEVYFEAFNEWIREVTVLGVIYEDLD